MNCIFNFFSTFTRLLYKIAVATPAREINRKKASLKKCLSFLSSCVLGLLSEIKNMDLAQTNSSDTFVPMSK